MTIKQYNEFIHHGYNNRKYMVHIIGLCIIVFETAFFISNLFTRKAMDFRVGYLASYLFLAIATLLALLAVGLTRKTKHYNVILASTLHVYDVCVMAWAIAIATMDAYRGSYPVVFIIVAFATPFFLVLFPAQNGILITIGTVFVLYATYLNKGYIGNGYLGNILVFFVVSNLVTNLCYLQARKRYGLERRLKESSTHDGLTGLYNRKALDDRFDSLSKEETHNTVVMIDWDRFKQINDKHGHRFGDEALTKIAELIKIKFGDDCYRYGGDEFIVITSLMNNRIITRLKEINNELEEHFDTVKVAITAGIYNVEGENTEQSIISKADEALYEAKNKNKGSYYIYQNEHEDNNL